MRNIKRNLLEEFKKEKNWGKSKIKFRGKYKRKFSETVEKFLKKSVR